jgi:hypothetical protein
VIANDSGEVAVVGLVEVGWVANGTAKFDRFERVGGIEF